MGSLSTRTPVSMGLQAPRGKPRKQFLSLQSRCWILASPPLTTCVAAGMSREPPALSGLTQQGGGRTDNPEGLLPIGTPWDSAMI